MKREGSPTVTEAMAAHIRYLLQRGNLHQHQIAALLGINQGRVSEVKKGTRQPGIPAARGPFPA